MKTPRVIRGLALSGTVAALLVGCTSAPEPPLSSPAPTLPEESIAYDEVPVVASRDNPFHGGCDQITGKPGLAQAMGFASTSDLSGSPAQCAGTSTSQGLLGVVIAYPTARIPDPWAAVWNKGGAGVHYRRQILLDRYYASSQIFQDMDQGTGCQLSVNVGSRDVLSFTATLPGREAMNYMITYGRYGDMKRLAARSCPMVQQAAEAFLNAVDPQGGSRAS